MRYGKEWKKGSVTVNVMDTLLTILQHLNMSDILHIGNFHIFLDLNSYLRHKNYQ